MFDIKINEAEKVITSYTPNGERSATYLNSAETVHDGEKYTVYYLNDAIAVVVDSHGYSLHTRRFTDSPLFYAWRHRNDYNKGRVLA